MKGLLRFLPALLILLTACLPRVTHHPRPDLSVDFLSSADLGCVVDGYDNWSCEPESKAYRLGCTSLREADPLLGGLQPAYPLAVCLYSPWDGYTTGFPGADEYFFNVGGLLPNFVRYLIAQDGQIRLLKNENDLRAVFAPVESPEEALAFALAARPVEAIYDLQPQTGYKYEVTELEETYVETLDDGYLVHVFYYQLFGCGPHYTQGIRLLVTGDGQIEELGRQNLFRDPEQDGLCVD